MKDIKFGSRSSAPSYGSREALKDGVRQQYAALTQGDRRSVAGLFDPSKSKRYEAALKLQRSSGYEEPEKVHALCQDVRRLYNRKRLATHAASQLAAVPGACFGTFPAMLLGMVAHAAVSSAGYLNGDPRDETSERGERAWGSTFGIVISACTRASQTLCLPVTGAIFGLEALLGRVEATDGFVPMKGHWASGGRQSSLVASTWA